MSLPWIQRKNRLAELLKTQGDDDEEGVALDRLLHGQSVIGKTSKTTEVDTLRFKDKDLSVAGTLEYGQFGVIDVVTCRLDGKVYVRKTTEKRFALRTRDQCSPQFERDILLQAAKLNSPWAPHLLCAYQTPTHLNLVMDYAEGGNLWDVLESSPHEGRILESDLRWWTPQIISAVHWCHSQGFVHRDIKPHNFVINQHAHVLLIDFGTAAPLLPPDLEGVQLLPKRHCLLPCGTCDYISPEILKAHEEALVELEMEDDEDFKAQKSASSEVGYGRETDWWSLGAMLYEMAYGVAPFFAKDIRQTYLRIMEHERSLRFDHAIPITPQYQHFISCLLTVPERRLGRRNIDEITNHNLFEEVNWDTLSTQPPPSNLHLPQFTYAQPQNLDASPLPPAEEEESAYSQGFAFSALFQSSVGSASPGLSLRRSTSSVPNERPKEDDLTSAFIGFSWGPTIDAFPSVAPAPEPSVPNPDVLATPKSVRVPSSYMTPNPGLITPRWPTSRPTPASDPVTAQDKFKTPMRPTSLGVGTPFHTLQRPGTIARSAARRSVSDREAMKQLVHCIGMSARKKVLESGKKPRLLNSFSYSSNANGTFRKELRFDRSHPPPAAPKFGGPADDEDESMHTISFAGLPPGARPKPFPSEFAKPGQPGPLTINVEDVDQMGFSSAEDTESEGPPSPSPTPRPGSAMSMISRRSATPTFTSLKMFAQSTGGRSRSGSLSQSQSQLSVNLTRSDANSTQMMPAASEPPSVEQMRDYSDEEGSNEEDPEEEDEEEDEEEEEDYHEREMDYKTPTIEQMEGRLMIMLGDLRKAESTLEQVRRMLGGSGGRSYFGN